MCSRACSHTACASRDNPFRIEGKGAVSGFPFPNAFWFFLFAFRAQTHTQRQQTHIPTPPAPTNSRANTRGFLCPYAPPTPSSPWFFLILLGLVDRAVVFPHRHCLPHLHRHRLHPHHSSQLYPLSYLHLPVRPPPLPLSPRQRPLPPPLRTPSASSPIALPTVRSSCRRRRPPSRPYLRTCPRSRVAV